MGIVFIGGSRNVTRLPTQLHRRIDTIVRKTFAVAVGDAAGIDTAVQSYLGTAGYRNVTVFCAARPRNNIGHWPFAACRRQGTGRRGLLFMRRRTAQWQESPTLV